MAGSGSSGALGRSASSLNVATAATPAAVAATTSLTSTPRALSVDGGGTLDVDAPIVDGDVGNADASSCVAEPPLVPRSDSIDNVTRECDTREEEQADGRKEDDSPASRANHDGVLPVEIGNSAVALCEDDDGSFALSNARELRDESAEKSPSSSTGKRKKHHSRCASEPNLDLIFNVKDAVALSSPVDDEAVISSAGIAPLDSILESPSPSRTSSISSSAAGTPNALFNFD